MTQSSNSSEKESKDQRIVCQSTATLALRTSMIRVCFVCANTHGADKHPYGTNAVYSSSNATMTPLLMTLC